MVVETIAVSADVDVDGGQLTTLMVDRLRERGFDATWGSRGDVICALSMSQTTRFGVSVAPVATLGCDVSDQTFQTRGEAQSNVGQEYRLSTRNVDSSAAAQNAVDRMVPHLERVLRKTDGQSR